MIDILSHMEILLLNMLNLLKIQFFLVFFQNFPIARFFQVFLGFKVKWQPCQNQVFFIVFLP